jgi:hypothetical protein
MKPDTEKKLKKIERMSTVLRVVCKVGIVVVTCVFLAGMAADLIGRGTFTYSDNVAIPLAPLSLPARLVLAVATGLMLVVSVKGFYHLNRLLANYGQGNIFTVDSAGQIRQLGITVLLWFGVNLLFAITAAAVEPTPFSIQFHGDSLVLGPIIIVISWFMEMAAEMREENELTI